MLFSFLAKVEANGWKLVYQYNQKNCRLWIWILILLLRGSAAAVDKVYKAKCLLKKTEYRMYWCMQKITDVSSYVYLH